MFYHDYLFIYLWLHQWHMEVPRWGVESAHHSHSNARSQHVSDLHHKHSSQQCHILNPLTGAMDQICVFMCTSQLHNGDSWHHFYGSASSWGPETGWPVCSCVCLCEHAFLVISSHWRRVEMEDKEAQLCVISYLLCVCHLQGSYTRVRHKYQYSFPLVSDG